MSTAIRATVILVPDQGEARKMRTLQVEAYAGDVRPDLEHWEPVGITCRPMDAPEDGRGAEALVIDLGDAEGSASHSVILVVSDRRYRPTGLQPGDASCWSEHGTGADQVRVDLLEDRIEVRAPLLQAIQDAQVDRDLLVKRNAEVKGWEKVTGYVDAGSFKVAGTPGENGILTLNDPTTGAPLGALVITRGIITGVTASGLSVWAPIP